MIEVQKYDAEKYGFRRCCVCFDKDSRNVILNEVVIGSNGCGLQIILCNKCLEELRNKISDRLVQSDLEEEYETVKM